LWFRKNFSMHRRNPATVSLDAGNARDVRLEPALLPSIPVLLLISLSLGLPLASRPMTG
jgi:hypothetical protein